MHESARASTFAIFDAAIPVAGLPEHDCAMGLSAILEEQGGVKSYWALAHPAGQARFPRTRLASRWRFRHREARMKFGIDRLLAEPELRKPLDGQARRAGRASGLGDRST